ncbi:MAG: glutathione S-transferase family protein [Rhodospirillaceae bacterium]|mgnify:CR=1 FL=1|jgi:glutathione S-transferase|nr:glutathione S-transferase family protein [Rhodospirillaceae bacterium]MBT5455938.1 glutathione S-transferase family protein [Rhodospirillaceae bacterium]
MPSKFKLCSFRTCPWVHRAAIVLQEKGVDYEIDYIDRDNRPDWFLKISPHSKVPVLIIDDETALFESGAIAEYLDEVIEPRLHPADALKRAQNRAWTDYVPIFSDITHVSNATDEADLKKRAEGVSAKLAKLEDALSKRGNDGPYFNGPDFSLVDASYAPSLLRYSFMERLYPLGLMDQYPLLAAWRDALVARPSVMNAVGQDFEDFWRENLKNKNRWVAQFIGQAAAE